jgi:hypothetical protein
MADGRQSTGLCESYWRYGDLHLCAACQLQVAGKLSYLAQLAAVTAELLVHIMDENSGKHFYLA